MATATASDAIPAKAPKKIDLRSRGDGGDTTFKVLAIVAALAVLLILAAVAVTMTVGAVPVLRSMGFDFLTSTRWSPGEDIYGAVPFVYGTLYTALIAVAISVPVSLGVALFITQVAPPQLKRPLVYLVDLLAVVPSVVFGLWGILVLVPVLGSSILTAGIILAIMITPIITSLSREVIETTAQSDKEAAYGLGATRWEMIQAAVWPHSRAGVVGAVMLGLGRAMGETIAAALVIGNSNHITANPFGSGYSMPSVIANEWGEADPGHKSALIALAMLLFLITIVVNLIASTIVRRSQIRTGGKR